MKDPRVRRDGGCLVCREPRVRPKHAGYATRAQFEADAFCSAECAKAWWKAKKEEAA